MFSWSRMVWVTAGAELTPLLFPDVPLSFQLLMWALRRRGSFCSVSSCLWVDEVRFSVNADNHKDLESLKAKNVHVFVKVSTATTWSWPCFNWRKALCLCTGVWTSRERPCSGCCWGVSGPAEHRLSLPRGGCWWLVTASEEYSMNPRFPTSQS